MWGGQGLSLCRQLSADSDTPIVLVTRPGNEASIFLGLQTGASDFLVHPFEVEALIDIIRVLTSSVVKPPGKQTLVAGSLEIDFARRSIAVRGQDVHFARREFDVLLPWFFKPAESAPATSSCETSGDTAPRTQSH